MSLQILSNTIMEGRVNRTNEFEMKLLYPIDALNNPVFIEVLEVSYPASTKNVGENDCWFILQIFYEDFKKNTDQTYEKCKLQFLSKDFIIPEGIYSLKKLINFLNNMLEEYDIFFLKDNDGKIRVSVNMYIEYWKKSNKFELSSKSCENLKKKTKISLLLKLSKKLAFMLGFKLEDLHFEQENNNETINTTAQTILSDYLPDVSDGLNKFYIYCDELERVLVGDTSAELLAIIPIDWVKQGTGTGELINYSVDKVKKKFKKTIISSLHISLKDGEGKLIPFDSGSVLINCIIHNA